MEGPRHEVGDSDSLAWISVTIAPILQSSVMVLFSNEILSRFRNKIGVSKKRKHVCAMPVIQGEGGRGSALRWELFHLERIQTVLHLDEQTYSFTLPPSAARVKVVLDKE